MSVILIIDDNQDIRSFLTEALNDEGYKSIEAANGKAALDILRRVTIGLILLDMKMPVMNGATFLVAYQSFPFPRSPVIVISANKRIASELTSDVVIFIQKPFDLTVLIAQVRKYILSVPPTAGLKVIKPG